MKSLKNVGAMVAKTVKNIVLALTMMCVASASALAASLPPELSAKLNAMQRMHQGTCSFNGGQPELCIVFQDGADLYFIIGKKTHEGIIPVQVRKVTNGQGEILWSDPNSLV